MRKADQVSIIQFFWALWVFFQFWSIIPILAAAALVADRSKGSMNIVSEKRGVDPRCINAANPFHECAEYCSQKIREAA